MRHEPSSIACTPKISPRVGETHPAKKAMAASGEKPPLMALNLRYFDRFGRCFDGWDYFVAIGLERLGGGHIRIEDDWLNLRGDAFQI
jgi:hypothetical protein